MVKLGGWLVVLAKARISSLHAEQKQGNVWIEWRIADLLHRIPGRSCDRVHDGGYVLCEGAIAERQVDGT